MITGVNRDTLITMGWLDLSKGSQILHIPDMAGRNYSIQLTNTALAYVGKRTTGTEVGDYLICGPRWKGDGSTFNIVKNLPSILL